jgi:hypothetical protein
MLHIDSYRKLINYRHAVLEINPNNPAQYAHGQTDAIQGRH